MSTICWIIARLCVLNYLILQRMLKLNAFVYCSNTPISGMISDSVLPSDASKGATTCLSMVYMGMYLMISSLFGDVSNSSSIACFNQLNWSVRNLHLEGRALLSQSCHTLSQYCGGYMFFFTACPGCVLLLRVLKVVSCRGKFAGLWH